MKKILTLSALLVAFTSIVFGASLRDAVVEKLLALKAREFINATLATNVIKEHHNFSATNATFHAIYYDCRSQSYELAFNGSRVEIEDGNKPWSFNRYYYLRSIVVAQIKEQLHQGDSLVEVYTLLRPDMLKALTTQDVEFRRNLLETVKTGIKAFTFVQKKEYRDNFTAYIALEDKDQTNTKLTGIEAMLAANKSAKEIVAFNESEDDVVEVPAFTPLPDIDLAKFALRRYNEGGDVLVKKYLTILRTAQEDIEATLKLK